MPESSYLQTILNSFGMLDIGSLESNLRKDYSYHGTTADIFLKKMGEIFASHKNSGDTLLDIYEGNCGGTNCPNCGMKGYRFVGNYSRNYMDLVFEIEGDDIKDIYSCIVFKTKVDAGQINSKCEIDLDADEFVSFNATSEYQSKLNAALTAVDEIVTSPPRKLTFHDLSEWVEKHAPTNLLLGVFDPTEPNMKWTPFLMLYSELKEISGFISLNRAEITLAASRIAELTNEEQLLEWLTDHEEIGNEAPWLLKYTFTKEGNDLRWNDKNPIYFSGGIFHETINFLEYYEQHYSEMFDKYTTNTNEDTSFLDNISTDVEKKQLYSLRYHLEKRKTLEAEGVITPLYINNGMEDDDI